jgi:hypothetical protein
VDPRKREGTPVAVRRGTTRKRVREMKIVVTGSSGVIGS